MLPPKEYILSAMDDGPKCVLYLEVALYDCCTVVSVVGASSGLDGYIKLWDMESGKLLKSIDGGPGTYMQDIIM